MMELRRVDCSTQGDSRSDVFSLRRKKLLGES